MHALSIEARRYGRVVVARFAKRIERASSGIDNEQRRDARKALCRRIVVRQRPVIGVLHVRVVFVHEAVAAPIDDDPAHRDRAIGWASRYPVVLPADADAELVGGIGMMK